MNPVRALNLTAAALLALAATAAQAAPPPSAGSALEIQVRDSVTGRGLDRAASVAVTDPQGRKLAPVRGPRASAAQGAERRRFEVPPGLNRLSVRAPGYRPSQAAVQVEKGKTLPVKVWLDPEQQPPELRPEQVREKLLLGKTLLHGHVTDQVTGQPVDGATVTLERSEAWAVTDEKGYFTLYGSPSAGAKSPDPELPSSDTLVVSQSGFKTHRIVDTALIPDGNTHFIIELQPGEGVVERDDTHKLIRKAREAASQQLLAPKK